MMRNQGPGQWGASLSDEVVSAMSDEQKAQLEALRKAAESINAEWSGMEAEHNPVTIPEDKQGQ